MSIKEAVDYLSKAMTDDPDYAYSWYANINMIIQDAGCPRDVAEKSAMRLMRHLFDVRPEVLKEFVK